MIKQIFAFSAFLAFVSTSVFGGNHKFFKKNDDEAPSRVIFGITYGKRSVNVKTRDVYYSGRQLELGEESVGNFGLMLNFNAKRFMGHVNADFFGSSSFGWDVQLGAGWKLIATKYFSVGPMLTIGGGFATNSLGSFDISTTDPFGKKIGDHIFYGRNWQTFDANGNPTGTIGSDIRVSLRTSYFNTRPMFIAQAHLGKFTFHAEMAYNLALSNPGKIVNAGKAYTVDESDNGNLFKVAQLINDGQYPKEASEEVADIGDYIKNKAGQSVKSNPVSYSGFMWGIGLAYTIGTNDDQ